MDERDIDQAEEARRRAIEAEQRAEEARREAEHQAMLARQAEADAEHQAEMHARQAAEDDAEHLYVADRADEVEPVAHADVDRDDEHLPWLESPEDYDDEEGSGLRIMAMVLLGILFLALVIGSIYWLTQKDRTTMDGDGSLIAAPEGDYKAQPDDPQAHEAEGTGDMSFAASEGEQLDARLGDGKSETGKSEADKSESSGTAAAKSTASDSAQAGGVLVQLGAFSNQASAEKSWNQLAGKFSFVGGFKQRIIPANIDGGTVYRLNLVAPNLSAANNLCSRLKNAGENCIVKP